MAETILTGLGLISLVLALAGCAYTITAASVTRRFALGSAAPAAAAPTVSILKPLRGAEPELYENLRSFCLQDYTGGIRIIFGVHDASDPAARVVERLIDEFPHDALELVVSPGLAAVNGKISNLIAMTAALRNDVVVLSDSDIRVAPDYLRNVVTTLSAPGVGLVTCLYRGEPDGNLWARIAAMAIDYQFLPNVLVGLALKLARPCFGSTIALSLKTLEAIGGFQAFADDLADDHAMGEAVRRLGLSVALAPIIVSHRCTEQNFEDLFHHELRWARTIRLLDPIGYAGTVITHPIALAFIAWVLRGFDRVAALTLAAAFVCRLILQKAVDEKLQRRSHRWRLTAMRDLFSFAIFVASYFVRIVSWRGRRYKIRSDGTMTEVGF